MDFPQTPAPPYYAVVFASQLAANSAGYAKMAEQMRELAAQQPGFLSMQSARDANGYGITVSYWKDEESINNWRANAKHQIAQKMGREKWYPAYSIRIAKVTRARNSPPRKTKK